MKTDAPVPVIDRALLDLPLLDLAQANGPLEPELLAACGRVLRSQRFILGPEVSAFESELGAHLGARDVVGVSSGTDALVVALHALGIGPGDDVITTPLSFFATAGAILRVGARPVFADVDPHTWTLDPEAVRRALTPATRAILPVHLFGQSADMGGLLDVARERDFIVLEDAAQAVGALYAGAPVGLLGHAGAISFFPTKNLGGFGDGGAVITRLPELGEKLRRVRGHGFERKHVAVEAGGNYRLDELQAALLRVKLPRLEAWTEARRENAARYRELFGALLELPRQDFSLLEESPKGRHVYNQFVIRVPARDDLQRHLRTRRIETAVYYPLPLHLQPVLAHLGYRRGDFPIAERACREGVALPMSAELRPHAIERVAREVASFIRGGTPG